MFGLELRELQALRIQASYQLKRSDSNKRSVSCKEEQHTWSMNKDNNKNAGRVLNH